MGQAEKKYQDLESPEEEDLPAWQTEMIDERLAAIENKPERLRPVDELFAELDKD